MTLQVTAESNANGSAAALSVLAFANGGVDFPDFEADDFDSEDFETEITRGSALQALATVDAAGAEQIQPGRNPGVVVQRVGWYVTVDGSSILDLLTPDGIAVSRSMDRALQTATFSAYAKDGVSSLGDPLQMGAPITGLKEIEVGLQYMTTQGVVVTEPLISQGICESSERQMGLIIVDSINVVDGLARYLNTRVSRTVPAGSNMPRTRFLRLLASDAGVPSTRVAVSGSHGKIRKQIELAKGDWYSLAQAQYDVPGGRILYDRHGSLVVRMQNLERGRKPARWSFGADDLVSMVGDSPVQMGFFNAPEAYTHVSARGTEQVERDGSCGAESQNRVSEVQTVKALPALPWQQAGHASTQSFTASGALGDPNAVLRKTQEIVTTTTKECDEVVSEIREVYGFHKRSTARFRLDGNSVDLGINFYLQCFTESQDATGPAWADSVERWMLLERTTRDRVFDDEGYLTEERETVERLYNPRVAMKSRSLPSDTWETSKAPNTADVLQLGTGEAVAENTERMRTTETTVVEYQRSGSYLKAKLTTRSGFLARPGSTFQYHDGFESSDAQEVLREVETQTETWEFVDEQRVAYNSVKTGAQGEYIDSESRTEYGSLPAAAKRANFEPQREDFETDEEFQAAAAANQFEQQEITADCSAPALLSVRPKRELDEAFWEWAEDEGELQDLCTRTILKGQSPIFRGTVMAHARLEEGDWIDVAGPRGIFVIDGFARNVEHVEINGGLATTFDMQVYPRALAA